MVTTGASPSQSFAKIVYSYHEQYGEPGPSSQRLDTPLQPAVILDEDGGMIASLMGSLEETIRARIPSSSWETNDDQMSEEERTALLREHRTWQLLRSVLENRISRQNFQNLSAQEQLEQDPYISPEDLIQTMVNEDPELSLFATLVEHLQSRPLLNTPPPLEARHGYLPSTVRRCKTEQLRGGPPSPSSIDPDFTLRDPQGKGLAGEDRTYQVPLLETLWDLVRHGELDQAVRVCEEGGEPWRGATMMGGRRWNMNGLTRAASLGQMEGNRTRMLWKKSCRAIAKNPALGTAERSLYAALISDLPTLLPACTSWEDHLWAHIQSRMESRLEQRWNNLGGFWQKEETLVGQDDGEELLGSLDEVFVNIAQTGSVEARMQANDAYVVAQRMIIQGRSEALFNQIVDNIPHMQLSMSSQLIGPLLRFFAHLVLVLRSLGQPVPDTAANIILQTYLGVLEQEGDHGLIAMYAACLREGNGEESYARILRCMDPSASREAKMEALQRAKQHNLNVATIATETVRMILEAVFSDIPALSGDQPEITNFGAGLSETDVGIIRSIEWLTLIPETAEEALVQSNAVGRYFLALGHAEAAQAMLKTLPSVMASNNDDPEYHLVEHEHFGMLFRVFAAHESVDDIMSRQPIHTATKMEQRTWKRDLVVAIERAAQLTVNLLMGDWLRFDVTPSSSRQAELARIRQIFIPDLVFRLHALLTTHHSHAPHLLQRALALVKVVADEDNHVYEEFFGRGKDAYRLITYLDKVRETSLLSLKMGGSPLSMGQVEKSSAESIEC